MTDLHPFIVYHLQSTRGFLYKKMSNVHFYMSFIIDPLYTVNTSIWDKKIFSKWKHIDDLPRGTMYSTLRHIFFVPLSLEYWPLYGGLLFIFIPPPYSLS